MNRLITIVIMTVMATSIATAKPLTPEQVPEPLKPWIAWVLRDTADRNCPFFYNSFEQKRCTWPTQLKLDLAQHKGRFSIDWTVYQDSWVILPGDGRHWPINVSVDNKAALVMDRSGVPYVKLTAAKDRPMTYRIGGDFIWDRIPDTMAVPPDSGLINLTVNGAAIPNPAIKDGQIWLKESEAGQKRIENAANSIDIQVFRKINDSVPLQILTRLMLEVSGEQREVKLDRPVLNGSIPLSLQSPLPARLEPDGRLLLQLRPGRWQIDILSRTVRDMDTIAFNTADGNQGKATKTPPESWPQSEIWVFEAHPELRVVEIEGVPSVDPSQTRLPDDWKALPAYRIDQGQTLVFKKIRRGDPEPVPNQLSLNRTLWLDFDGGGYTVHDRIAGTMTRDWRLNVLPTTRLGRVTLDGKNQLITQMGGADKQGVEVRRGGIQLEADSRLQESIGHISAVGWEQSFHKVNAELNLPPGWRLLAASGVDNVPDSWISRWTLLDLFLVLIAALSTARLWTPAWGAFSLATLAISWHEPGSPHFIWLNLLAATALINALPAGRLLTFMTGYRKLSGLVLVLIAVPFMIDQVRTGLFPQLEKPWQTIIAPHSPAPVEGLSATPETDAVMEEGLAKPSALSSKANEYSGGALENRRYRDDTSVAYDRMDPGAKVQTGPGLPQWQWNRIPLSWNGAVDASQQVELWYLSPLMNGVLNFIRVASMTLLALLMAGMAGQFWFSLGPAKPMLFWLMFMPMLMLPQDKAHADFPDPEMLEALKNSLQEAPDCLPGCAHISQMNINVTDKDLKIALEIQAGQSVAVPLPADYEQWFPNRMTVDDEAVSGLYRNERALWVALEKGRHQVVMYGVTPLTRKFILPLPMKPGRLTFAASGWRIPGIEENGLVDSQLQFIRVNHAPETNGETLMAPGVLPPFVRVERLLHLGLGWRVATRINRVSPANSPVVLAIPLLPGESVTTPGIRVKKGLVDVNMGLQQTQLEWESVLEKSNRIELSAADTEQWVDVWKIDLSPIWHLESMGIPMIHLANASYRSPEWHPWPGEKILLKITRPEPFKGQTVTIDSSHLSIKPGLRTREAQLSLSLRSSQGGQHALTLPEQSELQSVAIDGRIQPIRQEGRQVTFPIKPGGQRITVDWREAKAITGILSTPVIDLGQGSVNASLNVALGQDRWVLFVVGPKMGPAVLFWGMLIVIVMLSQGLAKIPLTPLKNWQWFLLLVGLSQIPPLMAAVVVAWLMLLGWRSDQSPNDIPSFNAFQVMVGVLTLLSLSLLFFAVTQGLLSSPAMQIAGNRSTAYSLNWYQDRSPSLLPSATVISVPISVYRFLMLAWSLWLAMSLLDWFKWGWACFSSGGLWKKKIDEKQLAAESLEHES